MPQVMKLKDDRIETVFDLEDALDLVSRYGGCELRHYLEENLTDTAELEKELEELEKDHEQELERQGDHHRALLNDIKEEAEALEDLLEADRLDRKKLKKAADNIWRMCYREL